MTASDAAAAPAGAGGPVPCPSCNARLHASATKCWLCGYELPSMQEALMMEASPAGVERREKSKDEGPSTGRVILYGLGISLLVTVGVVFALVLVIVVAIVIVFLICIASLSAAP